MTEPGLIAKYLTTIRLKYFSDFSFGKSRARLQLGGNRTREFDLSAGSYTIQSGSNKF